ncbi:Valine-tRNA ligase [Quillaja saponaria]|uniref:Valine-tRNA ligase n=1 Tax=Quillaja saponaria TaxID=32244 RepID=A0AAD7VID8_QUISA|nr:Valine-tRNA ligase [Quillaja saponaria]
MSNWHLLNSRVCNVIIVCWILFSYFPGFILSAVVTLGSIEIFRTHDWIKTKPTVYFKCKDGNKTVLPDVEKASVLYNFRGEESWQPLTDLSSEKCKRCGFYEEDTIKSDYVFEEWELCPSDFAAPDGKYIRFKEKEYNATFFCMQCIPDSNSASHRHKGGHATEILLVVLLSALVTSVLILGVVAGYKYWLKKKREQDQARFLKLFEDEDDIEDELGLGNVI